MSAEAATILSTAEPLKTKSATSDQSSGKIDYLVNSESEPTAMEDMPSLDVLSFNAEPCSSKFCNCSSHKSHQDDGDVSTLFGGHATLRLPLKRQFAESPETPGSRCPDHCRHNKVLSPPSFLSPNPSVVFGAPCSLDSQPKLPIDMASSNKTTTFFHSDRADFASFDQLRVPEADRRLSSAAKQSATTLFNGSSFESLRQGGSGGGRSDGVDLSDLRAVLHDASSEMSSASSRLTAACPDHSPLAAATSGFASTPACTCSQQASRLDDWSVDELAGYLDDFCHIPKKMSAMAEMMYM